MDQIQVKLTNLYGSDKDLAAACWISSGRGDVTDPARIQKLIEMLIEQSHRTPFERIIAEFHMRLPQRIGVQLLRHRMASHSASSARYGHTFDEMYNFVFPAISIPMEDDTYDALVALQKASQKILEDYNAFMEKVKNHPNKKRLRELASFAIPQGVMVEQTMLINFNSLRNLLELRLDSHAQPEVQEVARQMRTALDGHEQIKHAVKFLPSLEGV